MKNFCDHKIEWVWTMRKLNTPLSVSSYLRGVKIGQKHFGYPIHLSATWYDHGDIYFDSEEIKVIEEFLRHKIQNSSIYPDIMSDKIFSLAKKINKHKISKKINKQPLSELVTTFKNEQKFFLEAIGFMSYRGSVQMADILRERLETILTYRLAQKEQLGILQECIEEFSHPCYESIIFEEKSFSLRLARDFKQLSQQKQEQRISQYLANYGWLSFHWFIGTPPTKEQVRKRLMLFAPTAKQELKRLEKEQKDIEKKIQKLSTDLKFNVREEVVLRQYRTWLFLRTFIKDNINKAAYKLLPILYEMGRRLEIEPKLMPFLTLEEIHHIINLSKKEIETRIENRRRGFSAGIVNNIFCFDRFEKLSKEKTSHNVTGLIKGAIAYKGRVRGVVKIVLSSKEQSSLKHGEILVTSMTTPDLLPAMERAAAFITDEGGITCHAAIVAREMKKPCLIGTRNATKVLKDGDLVEVDANQGVVRKLK